MLVQRVGQRGAHVVGEVQAPRKGVYMVSVVTICQRLHTIK